MANKPVKKAKVITSGMTKEELQDVLNRQEEEKRRQALQQLAQQRTSFAVNILCNLVHGVTSVPDNNPDIDRADLIDLVDLSVEMADHLMEKLYTVKKEESNDTH